MLGKRARELSPSGLSRKLQLPTQRETRVEHVSCAVLLGTVLLGCSRVGV